MDYSLKGKCFEETSKLVQEDKSLTQVRGHYYCPMTNRKEEHWWCVDEYDNIIDPTKGQFLSNGLGDYIPFNGMVECEECKKRLREEDAQWASRFPVCSTKCHLKLVGLEDFC